LSSVDNPPSPVAGSFNRSCKVSSTLSQEQMTDRLELILVLIISYMYRIRYRTADLQPAYDVLDDLAILDLSLPLRIPLISS
jgi:hypothetical protein